MDTISLRQSKHTRNRVTKNELRKMNRKGTTATSVWCEGNKNFNNQTTSLISSLPEEFLVEILSSLPPKPFFHHRSVCKYWLSLSSEAFGRNKHLQPTVHGLFHNGGYFSSFSCVSFGFNNADNDGVKISALSCLKYIWVHDCCNGLVLLSAQSKRQPLIDEIYVYNPSTRSLSSLGPVSMLHSTIFSLAFDSRAPSLLHLICFIRCNHIITALYLIGPKVLFDSVQAENIIYTDRSLRDLKRTFLG